LVAIGAEITETVKASGADIGAVMETAEQKLPGWQNVQNHSRP
jgi:replicative DNA helicase